MEFTQPQRSWLVRTTAVDSFPPLDPEMVAMLRKDYADMFEREDQPWKVNFDKHIAKARELESKVKDSKDDTDKYFRSIFDKQNANARELESKAKESKDA